jgi:hypothetical protein
MEEHRSSAAPRHDHRDFRMSDDRRDRRHYENGIDAMQPAAVVAGSWKSPRAASTCSVGVIVAGLRVIARTRNPVVSQQLDHAAPIFSTAPRSSLDVAENSYASAQRFEANVR